MSADATFKAWESGYPFALTIQEQRIALDAIRFALSAEGSATTAAARLAAEEMRERAAEDERDRLYTSAYDAGHFAAAAFLRLEDSMFASDRAVARFQDQAAATPTIADPDGEARS